MAHIAQCKTIITKCGKKLWKIKSIPRHIHFSWRILHKKLPVKNDLLKKGISSNPLCVLYGVSLVKASGLLHL